MATVPTASVRLLPGDEARVAQQGACAGPSQSPVHSAHVGQEVEVHYRWHPLYGRRVRRHYSEQRAAGQVVFVEAVPGVVTAIAAWMLDPVACAGMATVGAPRVTVSALLELHHLLIERGFRQSSRDHHIDVQGENMRKQPAPVQSSTVPRQLSMTLDSVRLRGMSPSERSTVLVRMASLLLEAAGIAAGEKEDDEH